MIDHGLSIFEKYAPPSSESVTPFHMSLQEHAQLHLFIDTLCKQKRHHLLLIKSSAEKFNDAIIETISQHLSSPAAPKILRGAHCLYFNVTAFLLNIKSVDDIENDFRILSENIRINNKRLVLIMTDPAPLLCTDMQTPLGTLGKFLRSILNNEQWRLILIASHDNQKNTYRHNSFINEYFTSIAIHPPTENETLAILKNHRIVLENFHQVTISDETLMTAIALASAYLSGISPLDNAIELLDNAAARANALSLQNSNEQKPIVTSTHLALVVSNMTQIPLSHLQNNKFQMNALMEALRTNIYGQDSAIQTIAATLQNACLRLHKKPGPLCSFLIAGSANTGKATFALELAQHLFGKQDALLRVNTSKFVHGLSHLMITTGLQSEYCMPLLTAIQQTPYAIVLFENIDKFSEEMHLIVKSILTQGYLIDEHNHIVDFHHAIIIITSTVGTEKIIRLLQSIPEKHKQIDLMQIILNEHINDPSHHLAPHQLKHEIMEQILPEVMAHFSAEIVQHVTVVPFLPLDYNSYEKIIRNQLKSFAKLLNSRFGIDLNCAPEIIKFLAHEAQWQPTPTKSLDKLLEQHLYSCVSHEILTRATDKNPLKKLLLQLNDNGQLLRCEFSQSQQETLT